ncbi:MAG: TetR/AcrR family transcriptional regulator [Pseudomonadota bacterium]
MNDKAAYHHGNLRKALLEEAVTTIEAQGVEALSMRQLAASLGVSHAAPRRHFESKGDLLSAIVTDAYTELTEAVFAHADDPALSRLERLNAMSRTAIDWALANRAKFQVMTNPDVSRFADEALKAALADFSAVLAKAITEARSDGFHDDAPMEALFPFLIGSTVGIAKLLTDPLMAGALNIAKEPQTGDLADLIVSPEE